MEETEEKAKETSTSLGSIGEALQSGLATAGIAIGVREIVGGFKEMIQSTMEAGVEIGRLREETGISAENLSELRYVAASTGTTFEALTKGFKNISTAVHEAEQGNPKATKAFAELGISVDDLRAKGDDMLGVLRMVADRFRDSRRRLQPGARDRYRRTRRERLLDQSVELRITELPPPGGIDLGQRRDGRRARKISALQGCRHGGPRAGRHAGPMP